MAACNAMDLLVIASLLHSLVAPAGPAASREQAYYMDSPSYAYLSSLHARC